MQINKKCLLPLLFRFKIFHVYLYSIHLWILPKYILLNVNLDQIEIMTSTVITCANAGLRDTAFKLAVKLLQGSYKDKLDKKYRRKLETIVR